MKENKLVSTQTLCSHYDIAYSFFDDLDKVGLIKIEIVEEKHFIHENQIRDLEKMIRIHHDLNINIEGIDVVFNLLENEKKLRHEVNTLKNRLSLYESGL